MHGIWIRDGEETSPERFVHGRWCAFRHFDSKLQAVVGESVKAMSEVGLKAVQVYIITRREQSRATRQIGAITTIALPQGVAQTAQRSGLHKALSVVRVLVHWSCGCLAKLVYAVQSLSSGMDVRMALNRN